MGTSCLGEGLVRDGLGPRHSGLDPQKPRFLGPGFLAPQVSPALSVGWAHGSSFHFWMHQLVSGQPFLEEAASEKVQGAACLCTPTRNDLQPCP